MARKYRSIALFCLLACGSLALAANPVPFLNNPLVPASVAPGSSAFTLTVNGTGFVPASVIKWKGSPRTTTFISSSQLKAAIPASDVVAAGSATITVNSGGPDSNLATLWIATSVPTIAFTQSQLQRASAPSGLAIADFNGDGKQDLALSNGFSDQVQLRPLIGALLGNGDGTFMTPVNYQTIPQPYAIALGDFNNDGKLDVAVSGLGATPLTSHWAIGILLGNGDGTFQEGTHFVAGTVSASRILVADFNRDGNLDIAAVDGRIAVLLGNGDGTFQHVLANPEGYTFTFVGDLNNDGILDLVGTNGNGGPVISLGNGDGTFQPPVVINPSNIARTVTLADLNGDGKLDIAFGSQFQGLSVCLGNGDATFQTCTVFQNDPNGGPAALAVTDLNGDGKVDILSSDPSEGLFTYLLGNGDGTFQPYVQFLATQPSGNLAISDFNGDGRPDVAFIGGTLMNDTLAVYKLIQNEQ